MNQLDPITTARVICDGEARLRSSSGVEPKLRDVIWYLLREAVRVDRSIMRPGPSQRVTMALQTVWTPQEIAQAYNEMHTELREAEAQKRAALQIYTSDAAPALPDAGAHWRYLEVMSWLRCITAKPRVGQRSRAALVLALAAGMSGRRAMEVFRDEQFPSPRAVYAAKDRALNRIEEAVRKALRQSVSLPG